MPIAILGIGLPGSGKSTTLARYVREHDCAYVCPDDIREELSGDAADQSCNDEVWEVAYLRISYFLAGARDVVVDATNAKKLDRIRLTAHCRKSADLIFGVWFNTPAGVCLERNRNRSRVVPEFALGRMAGWLDVNPPGVEDQFDTLIRVTPDTEDACAYIEQTVARFRAARDARNAKLQEKLAERAPRRRDRFDLSLLPSDTPAGH